MLLIIQFSTVFVRLEFDYVALSMSSSLILCQGLAPGFQFPAWVRIGQSRACNWIQQSPLSFSVSLSQSPLFLCTSVKLPSFPVYDPIGRAHQLPHDVIKPEASTGYNIETVPPRKSLSLFTSYCPTSTVFFFHHSSFHSSSMYPWASPLSITPFTSQHSYPPPATSIRPLSPSDIQ